MAGGRRPRTQPGMRRPIATDPSRDGDSTAQGIERSHGLDRRGQAAVVVVVILLAIPLRLYRLGERGLWIDELETRDLALQIFRAGFWRQSHFLAFMIFRGAMVFGQSEFILRIPSFVASLACVPVIYLAVRRWSTDWMVAAVAAAIASFSLYQASFAVEARYYALVTLFSAGSIYLLRGLLRTPSVIGLFLFLGLNLAAYGIHPSTAAFWGIQLAYLGGAQFTSVRRAKLMAHLNRVRRDRSALVAAIGTAIALTGILGWAYYLFLGGYIRAISLRLIDFPNIDLTEGVEFSLSFFLGPIRGFALLNGRNEGWSLQAGTTFTLFFLCGICVGVYRARGLAVFTLVAYLLTYLSLMLFKANIPYTTKYISFLYPLFAGCTALGMIEFWNLLLRIAGMREHRKAGLVCAFATLVGLQLTQTRDFRSFLKGEMKPVIPVLRRIREDHPEGGRLLTTPRGGPEFRNYAARNGFGEQEFEIIPLEGWDLPKYLDGGETLWICPAYEWNEAKSRKEFERMLDAFQAQKIAVFTSYAGEMYDTPLYRIDAGRLFIAGRMFSGVIGGTAGASRLRALADSRVRLGITGTPPRLGEFTVRSGDAPEEPIRFGVPPAGQTHITSEEFLIRRGDVELRANVRSHSEKPLPFQLFSSRGEIPGAFWHRHAEPLHGGVQFADGRQTFNLTRNGFVSYDVYAPAGAAYQIALEAVEDRPGPIWAEVSVNDAPLGIWAYDRADNSLGMNYGVVPFKFGMNRVTFSFLNDGPLLGYSPDLTDGNNDLMISRLLFGPIASAEKGANQFWPSEVFLPSEIYGPKIGFVDSAGRVSEVWHSYEEDSPCEIESKDKSLRIAIKPETRIGGLYSEPIPVDANHFLYFSFQVRSEGMAGREVNAMIVYLDEGLEVIVREWLFVSGVPGNPNWTRVPCLRRPPADARFAVLNLVARPGSTVAPFQPAHLWFTNMEILPRR